MSWNCRDSTGPHYLQWYFLDIKIYQKLGRFWMGSVNTCRVQHWLTVSMKHLVVILTLWQLAMEHLENWLDFLLNLYQTSETWTHLSQSFTTTIAFSWLPSLGSKARRAWNPWWKWTAAGIVDPMDPVDVIDRWNESEKYVIVIHKQSLKIYVYIYMYIYIY